MMKNKPFFQGITDFIFVEDPIEKADIIFVPGGAYPESAMQAAQLYRSGYAPLILPSGRFSKAAGVFPGEENTEWEYLRNILVSEQVPESAVLKEDRATFTWENAIFSREVLEQNNIRIKTAILSCQAFHARRCLTYYQQQFPDVRFIVRPVITKGISRENWFLDKEKAAVVLSELERCGQQFTCMIPEGDPVGWTPKK